MTALKTIQPEGWATPLGYANGMLGPNGILHVGGQVGWNADKVFEASDFVGQMEQSLANIRAIVEAAGGQVTDIARLTWFIKNKEEYLSRQREVGQAYRRVFGRHFPAMSVIVVKDFIEEGALLEIEATAHIG
jgi:enamine deaminase RidA (YjgF/YER057c/UK114 family)